MPSQPPTLRYYFVGFHFATHNRFAATLSAIYRIPTIRVPRRTENRQSAARIGPRRRAKRMRIVDPSTGTGPRVRSKNIIIINRTKRNLTSVFYGSVWLGSAAAKLSLLVHSHFPPIHCAFALLYFRLLLLFAFSSSVV